MQKFSDVRGFKDVRMNLDSSPEMLAPNEVGMVRNMIEENSSGRLVNMRGFDSVMTMTINTGFTMPVGDFKCVGTTKDINAGTIIYFLADVTTDRAKADRKHCILRMFTSNKKLEWILYSQYLLNFQYNYRVSASTIDDLLYFTDGYEGTPFADYNPPRKVNMVKAAGMTNPFNGSNVYQPGMVVSYLGKSYRCLSVTSAYPLTGTTVDIHWETANVGVYSALTWQILDRIKWPPAYAPTASYDTDLTFPNHLLRNQLFQFSGRNIYDDNEKSTWSPPSNIPLPSTSERLNGTYDYQSKSDNVINIWFNSGPPEVRAIEIAFRSGNTGNWQIVKRWEKYDENGDLVFGMENNIDLVYLFHNDEVVYGVDQIDHERLYDAVPQLSKHNTIIEKNRLIDAHYTEGFKNVEIDVALSVLQQDTAFASIGYNVDFYPTSQYTGRITEQILLCNNTNGTDYWWAFVFNISEAYYLCTGISIIKVECTPWSYADGWNTVKLGSEYVNKKIRGFAVVERGTKTLNEFKDEVCSQLRYSSSYCCAIALNNSPLSDMFVFNGYSSVKQVDDSYLSDPFLYIISESNETDLSNDGGQKFWDSHVTIINIDNSNLKYSTFQSGITHQLSLGYFDRAGRMGALYNNDDSKIYIPHQAEYSSKRLIKKNKIRWEINHKPPVWATYYGWFYAKQATVNYFLYASVMSIDKGRRVGSLSIDVETNIYDMNELIPSFNVKPYEFQKGDRLRFSFIKSSADKKYYTPTSYLDFEILDCYLPAGDETHFKKDSAGDYVLDQFGNKVLNPIYKRILIPDFDFESFGITSRNAIVNIYRPNKKNDTRIYRLIGTKFSISDPYTDSRAHSVTGTKNSNWNRNQTDYQSARGIMDNGDAYIFLRLMGDVFPCESDSYSDFYNSDSMSIGLMNIVNPDMRRVDYISKLLYSGLFIQDTRINNLSHVDSSDSVTLAEKYGPINHIEEVGFTLKILQTSKQSSLYIGRAGVTQPSSESKEILSSTKDVLGTLIVHDSDFGTVHPGSVVKNETRAYFFDFNSHAICRHAGNGIQNLCVDYNINSFMHEACTAFGSADNVDVIASFDQENSLVIWTFTDKTTASNSFTLAFRDTGGSKQDGFVAFFDFMPDEYGFSKKVITSFSGNELWVHNSNTAPRSNFYGVQYPYWVTVVLNKLLLIFKRWLTIFVGSSKKFSAPVAGDISIPATDNNPIGMMSLLKAGAFTSVNGKFVAEFGKNMTTRSITPAISDLVDGDDLQGQSLSVKLQGEETTEHKLLSVEVTGVAL